MSKPNKFGNPSRKHNNYGEHDYRGGGGDRRVIFRNGQKNFKNKQKDWTNSIRAHLEEEDIDMGGLSIEQGAKSASMRSNPNFNRHPRKGRGGGPSAPFHKRKLFESPNSWYRVTLPHGNKYEKSFIMKLLLDSINPIPFCPITWSPNGTCATFYVDDFKAAEKLSLLDRELQMPDGFKLLIKVVSGFPNVDITPELKEKIKLTMAKRYQAQNKAMDLTKFHSDPDLQDYFCALFKPVVLLTVIDIIAENIPELEALNLNDNRIHLLAHLKKVPTKLKNLKILHMKNNKMQNIDMLDPLSGLPLVELVLDGNPLCGKFKDKALYISEVRKRFPKVIKLDGTDLPPPISFDISEDEHKIPPSVQTFLCHSEGGPIIRQFLEQYFQIFDTDNRQPLLQAYHENATFSMTMSYPYGQRDKSSSWLNWYATDNRNLLKISDPQRRQKLLKQGHVSIVSFLNDMPKSTHDINSFTVDLTVFTPIMMSLTVSGMFKELKSGHKVPPIRAFFRTLVIVPAGSGFCIANEVLHITNATDAQAKTFNATPIVVAPPTPVPQLPVVQQMVPDDVTKQQMVQTMSTQSGMNFEWSTKCLEETAWNFERAIAVFTDLQKQGIVPPEAFMKPS